jgi:Na+/H+ antiporter NhaC
LSNDDQTDVRVADVPDKSLEFYGGPIASAVPMLFFIGWAIYLCVIAEAAAEVGLVLGAVIGLAVGMFLVKGPWSDYAQEIFNGMSDPVGVVAIVAWFWAGMFAEVLQAGGLVDGLVWIGAQTGFSGGLFVGATFLLAATFATAVGTGYGTTVAFCTLMYPAGILLGANPIVLFAAVLSGSAFGDNLAPVSDTTIVSATTQGTDVPGVVRSRVKYALLAAFPSLILFSIFGGGGGTMNAEQAQAVLEASTDPRGLILLIPFALVITLALRGNHLLTSLTWGIGVAIALIAALRLAPLGDILHVNTETESLGGALIDGIENYVYLAALILLIVAAGHIMKAGGAMQAAVGGLLRRAGRSVARTEVSSWLIVFVLNVFITVNTAAEIAAAPFVRKLGVAFKIHPYRRANLLDATTSALGYIFPWSAAVLLGYATLRNLQADYPFIEAIEPTQVWPWVFHGWFLAGIMLIAAATGFGRIYEGPDGEVLRHPPEEGPSD